MISSKGFLSPGPDRRPRMTAKHKGAVEKAMRAVIDHRQGGRNLHETRCLMVLEEVLAGLNSYPTDRSCHTCDYSMGDPDVQCSYWKQEVPDHALEAGCDHHQNHGAPF